MMRIRLLIILPHTIKSAGDHPYCNKSLRDQENRPRDHGS